MQTLQQRAAILINAGNIDDARVKAQQDACCHYCQQHGYQISEQDLYRIEGWSLGSNAPQLVRLRMLAVQGQLNVLVIPWTECLGPLPLWISPLVTKTIDGFYSYQVRIESVIAQYGVHDIYQQILLDAIHFVEHRPLYKRDNQGEKQP